MRADNGIKAASLDKIPQLLRAVRQQLVYCRVILQHCRMFLRKTIAKLKQLGDMTVHGGMSPIQKFR